MRWSDLPDGGLLELDAETTGAGIPLELELVDSGAGTTYALWFLAGTDTLLAVVEAEAA